MDLLFASSWSARLKGAVHSASLLKGAGTNQKPRFNLAFVPSRVAYTARASAEA